MPIGQKLLLLALAGALGTLGRYGLTLGMQKWTGGGFPWGTAAVNLLGCFVFGLVVGLGEGRLGLHPEWRAILLLGFAGAFTTFSTFVFDSKVLWEGMGWLVSMANMLGQVIVGFAALWLGLAAARALY